MTCRGKTLPFLAADAALLQIPIVLRVEMAERYFVDSLIEEDPIVLSGSEAQHLVKVMRAAEGDVVTLFDGSGAEFSAQVVAIGRTQAELAITERIEVDRETRAPITLGVALPKGDRQRWLVEKVVELGVARLVPLKVDRGVAAAGSAAEPQPQFA